MIIIATHLDTAGTSVAVDDKFHDCGCLPKLAGVTITGIELGLSKNSCARLTWLVYDQRVQRRIDWHAAEAVGNVGCLEITAANHLFDDGISRDLRINLAHLLIAEAINGLHYGCCVVLGENADKITGVDKVGDV